MCVGKIILKKLHFSAKFYSIAIVYTEISVIFVYTKNDNNMKNETLKNKVEERLIKNGNNVNEVKEMMAEHFEYAASKYTTVKAIAECIRTIY